MNEGVALNLPIAKLDELRCAICKHYLSCSPIRLLPDGNCICGRCTPLNCDVPTYRALQLETILNDVLFPCQFMKNGCSKKMLFGSTTEHESTCNYCKFPCPSLNPCTWEGFASQFYEHFREKHSDLIKKKVDFKIKIDENSQEVFAIIKQDLFFILKYEYCANGKSLKYDIRCSSKTEHDLFYKIRLTNDSKLDCSFALKLSKCRGFDSTFHGVENAVVLNMNKCLEILDLPSVVVVVLHLKRTDSIINNNNTEEKIAKVKSLVNYNLLEYTRCVKCQIYILSPLFYVIPRVGNVCSDCSTGYKSSQSYNLMLTFLIIILNYPCQWHGCNFVGKARQVKIHRLSCRFRSYKCFFPGCNVNLNIASVSNHVKTHVNATYSRNDVICKFSLSEPKNIQSEHYNVKYIFTIKDNTLITIRLAWSGTWQRMLLFSDLTNISIVVQFGHQHCKINSKPYILKSNEETRIELHEFPSCFKQEDVISVSIICIKKENDTKGAVPWLLLTLLVLFLSVLYNVY